MGFRDSNQDLLGFVHLVPERARERIIDIASTQFADVARTTNINRSRSAATTTSATASTTTRFGFGAFSGQQGGMCPIFNSIAPTLNNAKAITDVYQPHGKLTGAKGETPVTEVLPLVQDLLTQPGNDGDGYILFVTDGEPDFCDDGDHQCPVDAVVARVQKLAATGISTIVFGLKSDQSAISDLTLQTVANAGLNQPVAAPFAGNAVQNVCYGCSAVVGWKAEWTAAGSAPDCATVGKQVHGTYAPASGTATVYHPDPADRGDGRHRVGLWRLRLCRRCLFLQLDLVRGRRGSRFLGCHRKSEEETGQNYGEFAHGFSLRSADVVVMAKLQLSFPTRVRTVSKDSCGISSTRVQAGNSRYRSVCKCAPGTSSCSVKQRAFGSSLEARRGSGTLTQSES